MTTATTTTSYTLAQSHGARTRLRDFITFTPLEDGETVEVVSVTRDRMFPTGPVTVRRTMPIEQARDVYARHLRWGFTPF